MVLFDSERLAQLQASIHRAPLTPRVALRHDQQVFGSADSRAFKAFVSAAGLDDLLCSQVDPGTGDMAWTFTGDLSVTLMAVADQMRQINYANVAHLWRGELLAVRNAQNEKIGMVERGAVRALGIATHGVHLHGCTSDGNIWIQQRALNKKTGPGQWDTLMGGMVSAADTLESTLARETREEAGLELDQLTDLHYAGHFIMRMPSPPDGGLGYVVERIDWFKAVLPDNLFPNNQDGEVQQFKLVSPDTQDEMLADRVFTTEAAIILAQSWDWRCG
jgi:8-oxo-dGTP pyrophosphatase MutT (NUDIX family)